MRKLRWRSPTYLTLAKPSARTSNIDMRPFDEVIAREDATHARTNAIPQICPNAKGPPAANKRQLAAKVPTPLEINAISRSDTPRIGWAQKATPAKPEVAYMAARTKFASTSPKGGSCKTPVRK